MSGTNVRVREKTLQLPEEWLGAETKHNLMQKRRNHKPHHAMTSASLQNLQTDFSTIFNQLKRSRYICEFMVCKMWHISASVSGTTNKDLSDNQIEHLQFYQ